jgi:hypothetical protein
MSALDAAEETLHRQVELRIIVLHSPEQTLDNNPRLQLLPYLATKSLIGTFAGFNLFSRELPKILEVAVAPLGGENASLLVADYSGYNHYRSCGGVVGHKKGYSLANVRKLTGTAVNTLRKVSKIGGISESRKKRMEMEFSI